MTKMKACSKENSNDSVDPFSYWSTCISHFKKRTTSFPKYHFQPSVIGSILYIEHLVVPFLDEDINAVIVQLDIFFNVDKGFIMRSPVGKGKSSIFEKGFYEVNGYPDEREDMKQKDRCRAGGVVRELDLRPVRILLPTAHRLVPYFVPWLVNL